MPAPRRLLAALLLSTGTAHFVLGRRFEGIVPPVLGPPGPWVWGSGIAELACGLGLLCGRRDVRRSAALASAGLFVVVFPANVWMAIEAFRAPGSGAYRAATLVRLPVQVPLVLWALAVARAQEPVAPAQRV